MARIADRRGRVRRLPAFAVAVLLGLIGSHALQAGAGEAASEVPTRTDEARQDDQPTAGLQALKSRLEPLQYSATAEVLPRPKLHVRDVAFTTEGQHLVAGYGDWTTRGELKLFDSEQQECLKTVELPKGVTSVSCSRDGKWIAAGCWDHKAYIRDASTLEPIAEIVAGSRAVRVAFSPDSRWLATATEAGEIRLYNTADWEQAREFQADMFRFQHLAFSPDGTWLCVGGGSFEDQRFGRALIFGVGSGERLHVLEAGASPIGGIAFSADGARVATGSFDGTLRLWNPTTGQQQSMLKDGRRRGVVERVAFSPDGEALASAHRDGSVCLWDVSSGTLEKTLDDTDAAMSVAFSQDDSRLAIGDAQSVIHVWDPAQQKKVATFAGASEWDDASSPVLAVAVSPDGKHLATAHEDSSVRLRSPRTGEVTRVIDDHADVVLGLAFSPDSTWLATGSCDNTAQLWALEDHDAAPKVFRGHTDWILAVAFSPDGEQLATSGNDETVRLWDIPTGNAQCVFEGHRDGVRAVAFSPDGTRLVSAGADGTARLWSTETQERVAQSHGHQRPICAVAFSPEGATFATASEDKSIRIWNAADGSPLRELIGHEDIVWSLAFSPGGHTLASGGFDKTVRLWDPTTGALLQTLAGHQSVVTSVAYTSDATALFTAGYDATVRRWMADALPIAALADVPTGDEGEARFAYVLPDGQTMVTANSHHLLKFWDLQRGEVLETLRQQRGISCGVISNDGRLLLTGGFGTHVYLWDTASRQQVAAIDTGFSNPLSVAISPDAKSFAVGSTEGEIATFDLVSGEKRRDLSGKGLPVEGLEYSPDGALLASASGNWREWRVRGDVKLWDASSGEEIATLPGTQHKMRKVHFAKDGQRLMACGSQHEVLFYDVASRSLAFTLPTETEVSDFVMLPDGQTLALSLYGGEVSLWDVPSQEKLAEYQGHRGSDDSYVFSLAATPDGSTVVSCGGDARTKLWPTSLEDAAPAVPPLRSVRDDAKETFTVAFSPNSKLLATGSKDRTIRLRDAETLEVVRTIEGHHGLVSCVVFAPSGEWLASASSDGTVRLWDAETGEPMVSWRCHGETLSMVRSLAVSRDGSRLAAGNWDGETYIWDVAEQELLHTLPRQPLPVTDLAFSPDGKQLATSSGSWREPKTVGAIKIWDVETAAERIHFTNPTGEVRRIAFDPTGARLLSIGAGSTARIFDVQKRTEVATQEHARPLRSGLFVDERTIILADQTGGLRRWLWESNVQTDAFAGPSGNVSGLAAAPSGDRLATVDLSGFLHIWPLEAAGSEAAADALAEPGTTTADLVRSWRNSAEPARP